MTGSIILFVICLACALLFLGIGIYAQNRQKPMWFWSGSSVDASKITDVRRYNRENGTMWMCYSLWYFASAAAAFQSPLVSTLFLVLGCTVGMALLVTAYLRIFKKYSVR